MVHRTGSSEPDEFPHACLYQLHGASREFCSEQTSSFVRNKDGCCAIKCTSEIRKCIMCLSLGRDRRMVKPVVNTELGLCAEHQAEYDKPFIKATAASAGRRPVPPPPSQRLTPPAPPAAPPRPPPLPVPPKPMATAPPPAVPPAPLPPSPETQRRKAKRAIVVDEKDVAAALLRTDSLTPKEKRKLRLLGLGFSNAEIAKKIDGTEGSVGVAFAHIFSKLGLRDIPVSLKRPTLSEVASRIFVSDPEYLAQKRD